MPQLVTADELARMIDLGGDNPARVDVLTINDILNQVEDFVRAYTGRHFAPEPALVNGVDSADPVLKSFRVSRYGLQSFAQGRGIRIRIPDLREATQVTLDGNVLTENLDYVFDVFTSNEPYTSIKLVSWSAYIDPWTMLQVQSKLDITGRWGFNPSPESIRGVVRFLAGRMYRRRDAMFADQVDTGRGIFAYRAELPDDMLIAMDLYRMPNVAVV